MSSQPRKEAEVVVRYREPRDVIVGRRNTVETLRIPGVSEWRGLVMRAVPDTLTVRLLSVRQARGAVTAFVPRDAFVVVTDRSNLTIAEQVLDPWKSLTAGAVVAGVVGLLIYGVHESISTCCFPTGSP